MNTQLNIVTSAADGCGQPLSIRSMDHLPSRDHKGAEYKESFMLSKSFVSISWLFFGGCGVGNCGVYRPG